MGIGGLSFKVPESVYFDKAGKVLYVSNIDGEPWAKDGAGSIGKLGLDGKVIAAEWVEGLNAPKGMALSKGTLWVADLSEVVGIDVAKGAIIDADPRRRRCQAERSRRRRQGRALRLRFRDEEGAPDRGQDGDDAPREPQGPERRARATTARSTSSTAAGSIQVQPDKTLKMLADGMESGTDGVEPIKGGGFIVSGVDRR